MLPLLALLFQPQPPVATPAVQADPPAVVAPAPLQRLPEGVADVSGDLAAIVEKHRVPALAVAVVIDGKLARVGASGKRARGEDGDVSIYDLWHLGSCGKAMTSTLAATFVDKGELKWTSTLPELFPDEQIPEAWRAVTLENLLTHQAGVVSNLDPAFALEIINSKDPTPVQRRKVLKWAISKPPACKPNEKFSYSNIGYAIAGHALETKANKPFEELLTERVFTPLGITTAGIGAPLGDQPRGHRGPGFDAKPVKPDQWADNPKAIAPAGTYHMSMIDWAKFVAVHATGESEATLKLAGAKPFLPIDIIKKLHTRVDVKVELPSQPSPSGYALGWGVTDRPWAKGSPDSKGVAINHSGSNTMWFCVVWAAPERGLAVLVACNQAGPAAEKACDEVAAAMLTQKLHQDPKDMK